MDTPTLVGTGFLVLAVVVWIVCVYYAYISAPKFGRSGILWAVLTLIFSPIALMILYILPRKEPVHAAGSAKAKPVDPHDALYEVPKKHK